MANKQHLTILRQGVEVWNRWREEHPDVVPDFSEADLFRVELFDADLHGAILVKAKLNVATLVHCVFTGANLRDAELIGATLQSCELDDANLSYANLWNAGLDSAVLRRANLSHANLGKSKVLGTNFTNATLTGACIADWQIGSSTILDGVICDYIYRTIDRPGNFLGRLPVDPNSTFAPGEFTQRFQIFASALETIDLTFTEGIDWQAFFTTFQKLRSQHPNDNISIQGLERKAEGFIVRLEVKQEADKAAIETQAKQLYTIEVKALEAQYEKQLRLQGENHAEEIKRLIEAERQEKADLIGIIATLASNQGSKYDLRGSTFEGGFAATVEGDQIGRAKAPQNSQDIRGE